MNRFVLPSSTVTATTGATATAPARASARIAIDAPAARVWSVLTDVAAWPRWNAAVESVRSDGTFEAGSVFRWKSQGFTVTSTLVVVDAPLRLVWTGKAIGTRARHEWEIVTTDRGVVVTTSETFDGWLPRLMPRTMQRKLEATLPAWLAALKREAERR